MKNKYTLTRDENLWLARKRWDESIYCGMRMENRNVTFPQTQTILEGINVSGVGLDDIQAILNMRDAWKWLLAHLDEPLTVGYLCKLQEKIAYREALVWGELRTGSIGISGVKYVPPIPDYKQAESVLEQLLDSNVSATELALRVFAWVARSQLFWDGNKRTAMLAANKILIESGAGILLIPENVMLTFGKLLSAYYESGAPDALFKLLYDTGILGIDASATGKQELPDGTQVVNVSTGSNALDWPGKQLMPRTSVWLKQMRKQRGLTQRSLAEAIGVATNSLANIEQKQRKGSVEMWQKIENYFAMNETIANKRR